MLGSANRSKVGRIGASSNVFGAAGAFGASVRVLTLYPWRPQAQFGPKPWTGRSAHAHAIAPPLHCPVAPQPCATPDCSIAAPGRPKTAPVFHLAYSPKDRSPPVSTKRQSTAEKTWGLPLPPIMHRATWPPPPQDVDQTRATPTSAPSPCSQNSPNPPISASPSSKPLPNSWPL